ncbi:MAG TPA: ketol-acid reductoisomerase [Thermoanaerobaculia bacterium]
MREALSKATVLVLLLLAGCRSVTPPPVLERAIVTREHVEAAVEMEKQLAANYESEGEPWFEVRPGTARVLIVAGHATAQTREGSMKAPDRGTGSLAVALHELTGAPLIFTTKRSPSDPNYYDDNAFKTALEELIRQSRPLIVLDLHGSHSYRPYDVDFGTMQGKSLLGRGDYLTRLVEAIRGEGLMNLSQDYFAAGRQQTVTKFASARGVPAVQLEISSTCLDAGRDAMTAHRFAQILQALTRFIRSVDPAASGSLRRDRRNDG